MGLVLAVAGCVRSRPPTGPPLRVGTSGDYPPFSTERDGKLAGLDIEVAEAFGRDSGRPVEFVRLRWPDLERDVAAGRFDLAMGGVTIRPERTLAGTFTRPIVDSGAVVLARATTATTSADLDRRGLRLGVNAGGHLERVARRLFPNAMLVRTENNGQLPGLLETGAAEALLSDDIEASVLLKGLPITVHKVGPTLTRDRKAYLGRDPALVATLDTWMRAREADGTLAEMRGRWLGPSRVRPRSAFGSDLDALLALVDLRLAFMPMVAAAKERAHRALVDPAQEARVRAAARAQAEAHGLDPTTTEAFFQAQLDAARTAQAAFLSTPPALRGPVDALDLDRQLRPALAQVSDAIVVRAADVAAHPDALAHLDPARLARRLDPLFDPEPTRLAIARALCALRPRAPRP